MNAVKLHFDYLLSICIEKIKTEILGNRYGKGRKNIKEN